MAGLVIAAGIHVDVGAYKTAGDRGAKYRPVDISLKHSSARMLLVVLADDGEGLQEDFNLASLSGSGHYGLLGISERVALMGGRLSLQNQASGGLRIHAEFPHPRVIRGELDYIL